MQVKLWCLPRSGSNYLKWLLENNYFIHASQNKGGWKHGFYQFSTINNILIKKDVFPWLHSIFNYTKNSNDITDGHNLTFSQFLRSPIIIKPNSSSFKNPIVWWKSMMEHWTNNIPNLIIINYQELLADPETILDIYFNEHKSTENFQNQPFECLPSEENYNLSTVIYSDKPQIYTKEDIAYVEKFFK